MSHSKPLQEESEGEFEEGASSLPTPTSSVEAAPAPTSTAGTNVSPVSATAAEAAVLAAQPSAKQYVVAIPKPTLPVLEVADPLAIVEWEQHCQSQLRRLRPLPEEFDASLFVSTYVWEGACGSVGQHVNERRLPTDLTGVVDFCCVPTFPQRWSYSTSSSARCVGRPHPSRIW